MLLLLSSLSPTNTQGMQCGRTVSVVDRIVCMAGEHMREDGSCGPMRVE